MCKSCAAAPRERTVTTAVAERDGSQCALTFKGNALDGSARFETQSSVQRAR